jgi:hypothetical protein
MPLGESSRYVTLFRKPVGAEWPSFPQKNAKSKIIKPLQYKNLDITSMYEISMEQSIGSFEWRPR